MDRINPHAHINENNKWILNFTRYEIIPSDSEIGSAGCFAIHKSPQRRCHISPLPPPPPPPPPPRLVLCHGIIIWRLRCSNATLSRFQLSTQRRAAPSRTGREISSRAVRWHGPGKFDIGFFLGLFIVLVSTQQCPSRFQPNKSAASQLLKSIRIVGWFIDWLIYVSSLLLNGWNK